MNQRQFVIDGTDIICNLSQERLFTPLLQLLLSLHEQQKPFFCYFDADTRYKFDRDLDKQLYQSIIKFGLNDYFNQITGGDADRLILKQANDINATVISTQNFEAFQEEYNWLSPNANRLIQPIIANHHIILDELGIKIGLETDSILLAKQLINQLEDNRNNCHGVIDRYKTDRDFGFIRRADGEKKLFFHKKDVIDEKLPFETAETPVSFKIDIDNSGGIYYFCAVELEQKKEIDTQSLTAEKDKLTASKDFLQKQAVELKAAFEREMQEILQQNQQLQKENKTLKDQVALNNDSESDLAKQIKEERIAFETKTKEQATIISQKNQIIATLEKEIERLNAQKEAALKALERKAEESNSQAMTIDFQQEHISNLDEDLKAAVRLMQTPNLEDSEALMFDQLKQDYHVLLNSMGQKNSQIAFLNNNLEDLQTQMERMNSPVSQSTEIERLMEKLRELELNNETLKIQVDKLDVVNQPIIAKAEIPEETTVVQLDAPFKTVSETIVQLSDAAKRQRVEKPQNVIVEASRTELENWWYGLEEQWKMAFNQAVLARGESTTTPDEDQIRSLFKRKKIDIVGSGILLFGLNQLSFKLTNLSGLDELSQVEELNISGHDLTSLRGVEHLEKVDFLNCTSNQITTIEEVGYLKNLKTLIIQDNDLVNVRGVEKLKQLEYFNCLYNSRLKSVIHVKELSNLQIFCVDNYKTIIRLELEELMAKNPSLELRNV
jgi:cold shock CspA family protein